MYVQLGPKLKLKRGSESQTFSREGLFAVEKNSKLMFLMPLGLALTPDPLLHTPHMPLLKQGGNRAASLLAC